MPETAIARLEKTVLFQKLLEKENLLREHDISENIFSVVREIAPLLERIPENMPEFTLHNANHSAKVIEIMGKIIPSDTLDHLNIIELSILIYAAYLHDVGMTASQNEREEIIKNNSEFSKLRVSNEELSFNLNEAKKSGDHRLATFIEDKLFTEFLRRKHVERSNGLIKEKYGLEKTPISWKGVPYYKLVQAVCDSHGFPVRDLYDTRCWRRDALVKDQNVNVQYLSVVLRLADILDFDPERTPRCLLDFINPKDETSIKEWKKHLSIIGCKISQKEIGIEAECEHPIYERALREFIDMIETERKESVLLTSRYKDDLTEIYRLDLLKPITKENIRSNEEYIYSDFHFKLDFHRVIDLLMGERLYGDPTLTLRELLQNSVDAVRYRESMEKKEGNQFSPFIKITLKGNELIIEDNGIGMDKDIFENYFLQIGRSYYNSSECRTSGIEIDPASEFGIGILSVFMVASSFKVESRRKPLDPLNPPAPINVEIPTAYDYFVQRPSSRVDIGTKITLYLKTNHPFSSISLVEKISEIAPFIEYPIVVETREKIETYKPYLPGEISKNNPYIKKYFETTFNEFDISEGIEGTLRIVHPCEKTYQLIAQRGFSIPHHKLLPNWLYNGLQVSINLSGQAKLSLSPNRLNIIEDENYYKLIEKIQSKILCELEKNLKMYKDSNTLEKYVEYTNELMSEKILNIRDVNPSFGFIHRNDERKELMKKIFINHVPLLTIYCGKRAYEIIKDLDELLTVAIMPNNEWPENLSEEQIFEEIKSIINPNVIILLSGDKNEGNKLDFLYDILGRPSNIYLISLPGVVIESFNNKTPRIFTIGLNYFTQRMNSKVGTKEPLFVHYPENIRDPDRVIFNSQHRLLSIFIDGIHPKNENSLKALDFLYDSFGSVLNDLWVTVYSQYYRQKSGVEYNDNQNCMLTGVLKYYPELLNELCNAADEFWKNAQHVGAIPYGEKFPGFTIEDLPWFWSYDFKESSNNY